MKNELHLYEHNKESYEKVQEAFDNGEKVVGVVQATGTGKTYQAVNLALKNPHKKVVFLAPSNSILEHVLEIIKENGYDYERDFANLTLMSYQSLVNLSRSELESLSVDILVLDEFHHIGAPVWGEKVNSLIETHPELQILGMSAYTVRDRGTIYERDMANPDGGELFSNKIVHRYDIPDAMLDGVLPTLTYRTAYTKLENTLKALEERIKNKNSSKEEKELYEKLLQDVKRRIDRALDIEDMVERYVGKEDKIIYFCPVGSNIEEIKEEARKWFLRYVPLEDIVFYQTTSNMGELGKKNRDAFYQDVTMNGEDARHKLRVMFCINQYNEGVHAPNVNGVIMGRETKSDIVYFEQLGRALSVRGDTKKAFDEYSQYSREELVNMCLDKQIIVNEGMSKKSLIEKLISPYVIDLTNNIDFIKELENQIQSRIKERQEKKGKGFKRNFDIQDITFNIELVNEDIFEILKYVRERLTITWMDWYELAKNYYEHHGNLNVPTIFKTVNGYEYDEAGASLKSWINTQRKSYKNGNLSEERIDLLQKIGMTFDAREMQWQEMYNLAKKYYEHNGNLSVPQRFKTVNGYEYDEAGASLGSWIQTQRGVYKKGRLSEEKIQLLQKIGMVFDVREMQWQEMYDLAKKYYEYHGNLKVPRDFKTINVLLYDESGVSLGKWIQNQRVAYQKGKLSEEKIELLQNIGMTFGVREMQWQDMYDFAKKYYEHYGNLNAPVRFKTVNGYSYDESGVSLGKWIQTQEIDYKNGELSRERINLLQNIGMTFDFLEEQWQEMYDLVKKYYEHYKTLNIPWDFQTVNGYEYDESGVFLSSWIDTQRKSFKKGELSKDRIKLLTKIGMVFDLSEEHWRNMYNLAKKYYKHYGHLNIPGTFKTVNGFKYDESGAALGGWINKQRMDYKSGKLSKEKIELLQKIGIVFNVLEMQWQEMYNLAKKYYEYYGNLSVPQGFKTVNGYEYDESGKGLASWISRQRADYKASKLSEERIMLLQKIGMIFNVRKNREALHEICLKYGIDLNKNKDILNNISYFDLLVKIKYLEERQIDIVQNGYLHEIFDISGEVLAEKYGVRFEELVENYQKSRER